MMAPSSLMLLLSSFSAAAAFTVSPMRSGDATYSIRSSLPRMRCAVAMAGFGASPSAKGGSKKGAGKKPVAKLSMKRQWDRFQELVGNGAMRHPVYARISGEDAAWTEVGDVACINDVTVAAAVQCHKRLILEHAVRVSPKLALKSKSLECGYATRSSDGVTEPGLLEKTDASDVGAAGFEGGPDPSARYSALTNLDAVKQMDESNSKLKMGGY